MDRRSFIKAIGVAPGALMMGGAVAAEEVVLANNVDPVQTFTPSRNLMTVQWEEYVNFVCAQPRCNAVITGL